MDTTLRPMSLGEILDRAIQLLRRNLALFAGIAVLPELVGLAHSLAEIYRKQNANVILMPAARNAFLIESVLLVLSLAAAALEIAALCWAASRILQGEPVRVQDAYAALRGRAWRMIGVGTLIGLLAFWPMIPAAIAAVALFSAVTPLKLSGIWALVLIVTLMLAPCIATYPRYALGFPIAVVEGLTARASIGRSVELGRDFRMKVLGAVALPIAIALALFATVVIAVAWGQHITAHAWHAEWVWLSAEQVCVSAMRLLTVPLAAITMTLTYYDLRVRKEALDIERMMQQAGMTVDAQANEPEAPSLAGEPGGAVSDVAVSSEAAAVAGDTA